MKPLRGLPRDHAQGLAHLQPLTPRAGHNLSLLLQPAALHRLQGASWTLAALPVTSPFEAL